MLYDGLRGHVGGLRGHVGTFTYRPTLVNVEQVQVLKGPAAMEHGTLNQHRFEKSADAGLR